MTFRQMPIKEKLRGGVRISVIFKIVEDKEYEKAGK
jgi:hypothetical protein